MNIPEAWLLFGLNLAVGVVGWYLRRLIVTIDALKDRVTHIEALLQSDTDFARKMKKAA